MSAHGDITDITYEHPILGSGNFVAIANQTNSLDLGGFRTADDDGMIGSNGEPIYQINRVRGSFEVMVTGEGDSLERLRNLAASPIPAVFTFSLVNGRIYKGSGKPVGDLKTETNTGNITVKIAGASFEKIAG
jgi:hypothetical protein